MIEGTPRFLFEIDKCIVCLQPVNKTRHRRLDSDHVVPEIVAVHHPILIDVVEANENEVSVCPDDHALIDNYKEGKMKTYLRHKDKYKGLAHLFDFIVNKYPRSSDTHFRNMQFRQWRRIVKMTQDSMRFYSRLYHEDYYVPIINQLDGYLQIWNQFGFGEPTNEKSFTQQLQLLHSFVPID